MTARILLCHNYYSQSGGENHVFGNLARGLKAAGHPVVKYTQDSATIGELRLLEKLLIVPQAFSSPRTASAITHLVETDRPDVAVVQNVFPLMSPSVYTTLHELDVPIIQLLYNYRFICPNAHLFTHGEICERCVSGNYIHAVRLRCYRDSFAMSGWYAAIMAWHRVCRTFIEKIDRFIAPDQFMTEKLVASGFPREKMRVSVNPFLANDYAPVYKYGNYILYVGRLIEQKGILTLMRAMCQTQTDIRLSVVGHGDAGPAARALAADPRVEERVSFYGAVWDVDLTSLIAGARAIVIPSEWYDNLPLILNQTYAAGKPVIASDINGIPEYVSHGHDGFLFRPGDTASLADAIDQVASMTDAEVEQMGRAARHKAETVFDFSAYYKKFHAILDEIVK